ncbi:alpha/beta hydrolase [Alicyclobacillus dauci]|uniref:Lysophospholipase n=1 Tax=Alicyclobacillus dauci TaxID=1475485 RepID=A0ABY6Z378_9BACL|nr:alpha/beta hydrolase [Alicyclobacillus dauci]WAH36786.1 lysophospholipase [Alicyclobacillus dauci]
MKMNLPHCALAWHVSKINNWSELAQAKIEVAETHQRKGLVGDAELTLRTAGLYYNLAQWIFPERCSQKQHLFHLSRDAFRRADMLSDIETRYVKLDIDDNQCIGRIRIPSEPRGCVIIINPIDSSKEELFTYEKDFLDAHYVTISFDGPGQGETYVTNGLKATYKNWSEFVNKLIEYTVEHFPTIPAFIFGTSFGASWVIYGSCHPNISKAVAVSPAFDRQRMSMPDYFNERMNCIHGDDKDPFPDFEKLHYRNPVFLFHGGRDRMVKRSDIYHLYEMLPEGSRLIEYEEEMHCCNYKLREIRELAIEWYNEDRIFKPGVYSDVQI